jgi:hypothetical protein
MVEKKQMSSKVALIGWKSRKFDREMLANWIMYHNEQLISI